MVIIEIFWQNQPCGAHCKWVEEIFHKNTHHVEIVYWLR